MISLAELQRRIDCGDLSPDAALAQSLAEIDAQEKAIGAFVCRWLKEQALALLVPRALHFARRLKAKPPAVKLSDARAQWGSCNHRGEIRLNWRLVQLPPGIADYVVAHEVAHLIELNHSPRFWALVESVLPGHVQARRELDALTPLLD